MSSKLETNCSVKMKKEMHLNTQATADDLGVTVSEVIRIAWDYFYKSKKDIAKAVKILLESKPVDLDSIMFAGNQAYITNKTRLLRHKNAARDIDCLGEKANETIMEFIRSSIADGTLMSKGEIKTSDGTNIVLFRVHTYNVYCHFGPAQVTILSVS